MKKQFKNILKINLIIGKKQNLVMRKKKAVREEIKLQQIAKKDELK